jgi:hypothetical protein
MLINHIKSCEGKDKQVQLLLVDCNYINHFKRLSEVLAGSLFNAIVLAAPSNWVWDATLKSFLLVLAIAFGCCVSEAWKRHGSEPSLPEVWLLSEDGWTDLDRAGPSWTDGAAKAL